MLTVRCQCSVERPTTPMTTTREGRSGVAPRGSGCGQQNGRSAMTRTLEAMVILLCVGFVAPVSADYEKGLQAFERKDYHTAFREWLPAAQAGDAHGQFRVGPFFT